MSRGFPVWVKEAAYTLHCKGFSHSQLQSALDKRCRRRLKRAGPSLRTVNEWASREKWKIEDKLIAAKAGKALREKIVTAAQESIIDMLKISKSLGAQLTTQLAPQEAGGENLRPSINVSLQMWLLINQELKRRAKEGESEVDFGEILEAVLEPLFEILQAVLGDVFLEKRAEILTLFRKKIEEMEARDGRGK